VRRRIVGQEEFLERLDRGAEGLGDRGTNKFELGIPHPEFITPLLYYYNMRTEEKQSITNLNLYGRFSSCPQWPPLLEYEHVAVPWGC